MQRAKRDISNKGLALLKRSVLSMQDTHKIRHHGPMLYECLVNCSFMTNLACFQYLRIHRINCKVESMFCHSEEVFVLCSFCYLSATRIKPALTVKFVQSVSERSLLPRMC